MEEAIQLGQQAVDVLPVSKDAVQGPDEVATLADIYIMVGEYDRAIDRIEYLLSISSLMSRPLLEVDPLYDPLRDNPRFQQLLAREN
jgi:hypothetical protein